MESDHGSLWDRLPSPHLPHGEGDCDCPAVPEGPLRRIVLTGGPGAGKTAVITAARTIVCEHVVAVPEAASIIFSGGFPRHDTTAGRMAAQRAIYHVQLEGERLVEDEKIAHTVLCDRGTVDGEAYWPGEPDGYWAAIGERREDHLARYNLVIHMRTPAANQGYSHATNPIRHEDAKTALAIDNRIYAAWDGHPHRIVIEPQDEFEAKLHRALDEIRVSIAGN